LRCRAGHDVLVEFHRVALADDGSALFLSAGGLFARRGERGLQSAGLRGGRRDDQP
jgi:hypothetical protein